jgi:hypothetical protein
MDMNPIPGLLGPQMDPAVMGLLSAAAAGLQAAGPSRTPTSFGQTFGAALGAGVPAFQQTQQFNAQRQLQGLQTAKMLDDMAQTQQQRDAIRGYAQSLPENERAQFLANPNGYLAAKAKAMEPFSLRPNEVRYAGGQEVARAPAAPQLVTTIGPDGRPVQEYKVPTAGASFPVYQAPVIKDFGGSLQGIDPATLQPIGAPMPKTASPDAVLTDSRTRSEGALNRGVTTRGQDLVNNRAIEAFNAGGRQFDNERGIIVNTRDNTASPVMSGGQPIGPKPKELTDSQAKAALFGERMLKSDKVIADLADLGTDVSTPGSRSGMGLGATISAISSPQKQMLDQAKRDFINAVLRRESGAVISESEFDNAEKQYFPQIGDSPEVKAQKAENRKTATDGLLREVPAGVRSQLTSQIPEPPNKSKQFDIGGKAVIGRYEAATGKYFVIRNGKKFYIEE